MTEAATPSADLGESVVFVVDDDISVRQSLEVLIATAGLHAELFASAQEFLTRHKVVGPSCLVLDVGLPDLSGLDLQGLLAVQGEDMPIIFITGRGDVPTTVRAMKAGAVEFLTKPFDADVLLEAIHHAIEHNRASRAVEAGLHALRAAHASLSVREREVMGLVISGLLNKQVGDQLGISEITVKAHRGRVMRKMGADSIAELVTMAGRLGIAPTPKA
jgi:FixJ family two-component response regulator